ncbi:unnamed protein product [Pleuronectes platessa]|uniref:Uncharacterized protein n=1 Tax=Pleuronectes platessa TaxID=8262 RepID=A0A9N7U608_PLEPL|nr:unnamed protein product [Pleuronectes platessa]
MHTYAGNDTAERERVAAKGCGAGASQSYSSLLILQEEMTSSLANGIIADLKQNLDKLPVSEEGDDLSPPNAFKLAINGSAGRKEDDHIPALWETGRCVTG